MQFLTAPRVAVLDGYQPQRAPLMHWFRKYAVMAAIIGLALVYGFFSAVLPSAFMVYLAFPIALMVLLIVWLLPATDKAPTLLLRRLFYLYFGVMLLWPNYIAIVIGGLPWISLRRLVLVPTALTFLIALSVSRPLRKTLIGMRKANPYTWNLVVAFAIIQTLAVFGSDTISGSMNTYIDSLLAWTGIFFVTVCVFKDESQVERWVKRITLIAILLAFLGMVEFRIQHVLWRDYIPSFLRIADESVQRTLTAAFRGGRYRATMTFSVPLCFAEFLAVITPFVIHAFATTRNRWHQLLLLAADILILCAIYATFARLGMVGWIIAHVAYVYFWALKRWQGGKLGMFAPAITLAYPVLAAMLYVAVMTVPGIHNRVLGSSVTVSSDEARHTQYLLARERWKHRPVFGYGPGRAPAVINYVTPGGVTTVDSYMLTLAVDYGLLGLLAYTFMAFGTIFLLVRTTVFEQRGYLTLMAPTAVALMVYMVIRMILSQADNNPIFFALLGLSTALIYHHRSRQSMSSADAGSGQFEHTVHFSRT